LGNSAISHVYLGANPAAFASGDVYLVYDKTTNEIHLSSLGPVS